MTHDSQELLLEQILELVRLHHLTPQQAKQLLERAIYLVELAEKLAAKNLH